MFGLYGSGFHSHYGYGSRTFHYRNSLPTPPEPKQFNPANDLTDCVLWLDANDSSTIQVNEDTSGVNVNRVMKWFDKAQPSNQNYYHHVGDPAGSGLYNVHKMNQLNTIYFEPNAYMSHQDGGLVFPFQARTFFAVIKPLSDLTNPSNTAFLNIYNGFDSGAMNTGISYDAYTNTFNYTLCENGVSCGIVFTKGDNPLNTRMIFMFAQTDAIDLSGNAGAYDTVYESLTSSDPADSYDTVNKIQYYLNDNTKNTAQDIAEIIMYSRLLKEDEQRRVMDYLADKWNASGAGQDTFGGKPAEEESKLESFYPTYGYAIYGQFDEGFPNWFWCDENQNVESPPVLIDNFTGSTGDRDGQTYNILGTFYA